MAQLLEGKTIVVAGVGTGLGREVALAASRDGANVVLGARTEANLKSTAEEIDPTGERIAYAVTDLSEQADCENLIKVAAEKFGSVDAITIVAAKDAVFGGLEGADLDSWKDVFDFNVIAAL